MGTTLSQSYQPQTTDDVNAIIRGMGRAPDTDQSQAPLPTQLQPGYQTPLPTALAPQQASNLPVPQPPPSQPPPDANYTVGRPQPGDPGYQPPPPPSSQPPPATVAANRPIQPPPPQYQLGNQPGPWPAAYPNSPTFRSAQDMPALPGETPQETAALNGFAWRESNGQNIINSLAAKNPALYADPQNPRTGQGYWQDVNSTWATGARLAGVDLRQFPTAMSADYWTQRRVNLALYRAHGDAPWRADADAGEHGDLALLRPQLPLPPQTRDSQDWGHPPPRDFGPGPSGQQMGPFGQANFMQPGQSGFSRVFNAIAPLLVGIGSLALRLPLSTAITAYGAMAKAQDLGQRQAYDRARTQFQDQLKEANAQQTLESQAASDAFSEYSNNPQGLQQALARIALQYNDPTMYRMAEQGDLNGIHQMQAKRDQYNQDLTKLNKANQDAQDQRDLDADVAARDRAWREAHPNATPDEAAIAHEQNVGLASQDQAGPSKTATTDAEEAPVYNVIGPDNKPTGQQVRLGKNKGTFDLQGNPVTLKPGEQVEKAPSERPESTGQPKPSDYKDYTWDDPDGKHHGPSSAAMVPGKGLVDPMGNPIPAKPETIRTVTSATSTPAGSYPHEAGSGDYPDRPNRPPPDTDITDGEWRQALTYVNTGKAPTFARDKQAMARFREIIPVAMRSMGVTEDQMDRRWVDYAAYKTRQQRIEAAFAGGQDGKTLLALNTVAHHIDLFRQYADAMRNQDLPRMNSIIDNLAREGGAPELMDFNIVSRVTGDELVRVLTGTGGGTITDREDIAHQLSAYSSPEQFEGAANTLTNVLRGRFGPLQRAYSYGDPAKEKFFQENMMEPEARRMFQGEQQPIPGSPNQPQQFPVPPPEAIQQLKSDPGSRAHFDEVFGPGAAARVLGQ